MIVEKPCKNANIWKLENFTLLWGRINFDSVLRHRRSKFQQKPARDVRAIHVESESSGSEADYGRWITIRIEVF